MPVSVLAQAQTGGSFASIEAIVSQSSAVFTGTVERVAWGGHGDFTVTVDVDQQLKGKEGKTVALRRSHKANDPFHSYQAHWSESLWGSSSIPCE